MANLCIKQNGIIKKYELKDSVSSSPKLAVKQGGYTRYLPLKQGTKSGEIQIRVGGKIYYVQTKVYEDITTDTASGPITGALSGNRSYGSLVCWPIYNEKKEILAMIVTGYGESNSSDSDNGAGAYGNAYTDPTLNTTLQSNYGFTFKYANYNKVLWKIACARLASAGTGNTTSHVTSNTVGELKSKLLGTYSGVTPIISDYTATSENWNSSGWNSINNTSKEKYIRTPDANLSDSQYRIYVSDGGNCQSGIECGATWADANDHTKKYLKIYGWCTSYHCSCGIDWDLFLEFPEAGVLGCTPAEVINEWANALGDDTLIYHIKLSQLKKQITNSGGILGSTPKTKTVTDSNGYTHTVTTTAYSNTNYTRTYDTISCEGKSLSYEKYFYESGYYTYYYGHYIKGILCDNRGYIYIYLILKQGAKHRNYSYLSTLTETDLIICYAFDPSTGYTEVARYT